MASAKVTGEGAGRLVAVTVRAGGGPWTEALLPDQARRLATELLSAAYRADRPEPASEWP